MPLIAELPLKKLLEAVPSVLPSPEILANRLSLHFQVRGELKRSGALAGSALVATNIPQRKLLIEYLKKISRRWKPGMT
jgi:hypothetical protein